MNSTGIHARFKGKLSISAANITASRAAKFMSAASAVACAIALTSAAAAQSIPGACSVTPSPLASGGTILCDAPGTISGPVTSPAGDGVEDLTLVVGSTTAATTLASGATATVQLVGMGSQTVNVVNAGSLITGTDTAVAIEVSIGGTGDLTVNSQGTITAGGDGILAENFGSGSISITTADVAADDDAISALVRNGDVVVNTTAGTVTTGGRGIFAIQYGGGDISITTADVRSVDGVGIYAISESDDIGDIVIDSTAGTIEANYSGIYVGDFSSAGGEILITTADVTSSNSAAIVVNTDASDRVVINTVAGTITGDYGSIYVNNDGAGSVAITTADVVSTYESAIFVSAGYTGEDDATGIGGSILINTVAGTVTGDFDGIYVEQGGTGGIDISTANIHGRSDGIDVNASEFSTGSISIHTATGTVTGDDRGIEVDSHGSGAISITTADVFGYDNDGILVESGHYYGGAITINTVAGTVTGYDDGIDVESYGPGAISITTSDVYSYDEDGIEVDAYSIYAGNITINTVAGTVTGYEDGIDVSSHGAGEISITTYDVIGVDSDGITVRSFSDYNGNITINSAGAIVGGDVGITASSYGGSISITTADVTGHEDTGISAVASAGSITIDSRAGTVSGELAGIYARGGAGDIVITANNVTSVAGPAIFASNERAMVLRAITPLEGAGSLVVNTTGTVVGGSAGISLTNAGFTRSTVNNSGTVSATDGPAIEAFGAPATINNSGTVNGFVTLTDGDDLFNNTGNFNAGAGNDFGGGTDVFNNSGRVAVTTQDGIALAGLESFNNSGLVDLRNGQTGTVLTLPGDYVGSGNALLGVDVENGAAGVTSDLLVIAGAATGRTGIVINLLGSAGNQQGLENLVLVSAGEGSSASAFAVAAGLAEQGFLGIGIRFDEAANNYILDLGPSQASYRTSLYAEGMRNLWYKTADSWSRHMASVRNTPVEPGATYWISAVGEFTDRDNMRRPEFNNSARFHDLGYNQDYFGAQLGVDLNGGEGFTFGVTGGYLSSAQKFNASSDQVKYNAVNIGAYAGFTNGIVFANALAKYDRVWADPRSGEGRFNETLEGGVYGVRAEVGLTFGDAANGFYAEPAASLSYIQSNLDRLANAQGSVDFDEDEGLLGKFGGRVGFAGFTGTSLYLGANLVREFAGNDRIDLQTGGRNFSISNYAERNYAETMVGVNLGDPSGVASGVFELGYSDGGDRKGFGGSATINFKF